MVQTRAKGYRLENNTRKWMQEIIQARGLEADMNFVRVGMSGQLRGLSGDFILAVRTSKKVKQFQGEAKSGKQVPIWLYKTLEKDNSDFLVVKRDRKKRLWVLTDEVLRALLEAI